MKTTDRSSPVIARCSLVALTAAVILVAGCGRGDAPESAPAEPSATTDAIRNAGEAAGEGLKDAADAVADSIDQAAAAAAETAAAAKVAAAEKAKQAKAAASTAVDDASDAVGKAATDAARAVNQALAKPGAGGGMVVHTDPESGAIIPSPAPGTEPVGGDVKMPKLP